MSKMTMLREIPEGLRAEFWGGQARHFIVGLLDLQGSNPDFWSWSHCWDAPRVHRNRHPLPLCIVPSPSGGSLLTVPRMEPEAQEEVWTSEPNPKSLSREASGWGQKHSTWPSRYHFNWKTKQNKTKKEATHKLYWTQQTSNAWMRVQV